MNKNLTGRIFISVSLIVVFLLSSGSNAQDDMVVKGRVVYSKSMVDANLNSIKEIVKDGNHENGKIIPVHSTQIYGFTKTFEYFANFAEIEKVTGYSRDWFVTLKKALLEMYEPRAKMETATLNNNEKIVAENQIVYEKASKKFLDLLDHPQKAQKRK